MTLLRRLTLGLIACLAVADLAAAVWLWSLWQDRSPGAQPPAQLMLQAELRSPAADSACRSALLGQAALRGDCR